MQSLDGVYDNYKNGGKIIHLFSVWLYSYSGLCESYGFKGLGEFDKNDFECSIRFSFTSMDLIFQIVSSELRANFYLNFLMVF